MSTWKSALFASRPGLLGLSAFLGLLFASATTARNGDAVVYTVSFDQRLHHEVAVTVRFPPAASERLAVHMSRSSPGRYALHEFAKNVYSVRATTLDGDPLEVERTAPHVWTIAGAEGGAVFRYTLFGDRLDGTYAAIDHTHAHLNVPATFAWAEGLTTRPIEVRFELPHDWRVATQLQPTSDAAVFRAPNFDYFADSPIEISDHWVDSWSIAGPAERVQTVRLALHHLGDEHEAEAYAAMVRAVVAEEIAIYGEPPPFDFGVYTFLADYLPWSSGDGMEHRNSTVLTSSRPLRTGAVDNLGTVAHELFHAWSVERLRPDSLEPFAFDRANMSGELWFAEGFTSYYDDLVLRRIGVISVERFAERLSSMVGTVMGSSAPRYGSPVAMSQRAPFVDAASWIDPTNDGNTFLSYYTYGAAIGLALDLSLRERGSSLDALMTLLWQRFGRAERQYTNADLQAAVAELIDDIGWARSFFDRYVFAGELPPFGELLARGGFELRAASPDAAWLGDPKLVVEGGALLVVEPVRVGSPLYRAGVDRGDTILEIDGESVEIDGDGVESDGRSVEIDGETPLGVERLAELLAERSPGDSLELVISRRGGQRESVTVELAADPALEVVSFERAALPTTREVEAFRAAWLGSRAGGHPQLVRYCPLDRRSYPFEYEHCPTHGDALSLVPPSSDDPGR